MQCRLVLVVVCVAMSCAAVTVTLRDGKKITGSVVSKDDTNVVVATTAGIVTAAWRSVTVDMVKALHPELYARLKAQADDYARQKAEQAAKLEEEMRAKGMELWNGTWLTKTEVDARRLARVRLKVLIDEKSRNVKVDNSRSGTYSNNSKTNVKATKYWYEATVQMAGLLPADAHTLKVDVTQTLAPASGGKSNETVNVSKSIPVTGQADWSGEFTGSEYEREVRETQSVSTYDDGITKTREINKYKNETGKKSVHIAVRIWLDDKLIYEMRDKEKPIYNQVSQW